MASLTVDHSTDALFSTPIRPTRDDRQLVNDWRVDRVDGSYARVEDQDSIDARGRRKDSVTLNVEHDGQVADQAGWRLHLGTWAGMRVGQLPFDFAVAEDLIDGYLGVIEGDRVVVTNPPDEYPTSSTIDFIVEGADDTIDTENWNPQLNCSPAGPWEVGVRGDDAKGKRDTAGSELASGVNSSATSLSVATTLGPVWSADDADDGFDIDIGGERMTVTDISGAASPQTFTVTRSVNGIVKSHSAGAAVRLWRPTIRAL